VRYWSSCLGKNGKIGVRLQFSTYEVWLVVERGELITVRPLFFFRDYSPEMGRYVERDPIGMRGGLNNYGYANQKPTKKKDPYGLSANYCLDLYDPDSVLECLFGNYFYSPDDVLYKVETAAKGFWKCWGCEITCVAEFATPGIKDAAVAILNETAKRVAEETAKMAVKVVARRINLIFTVKDLAIAADCVMGCDGSDCCTGP